MAALLEAKGAPKVVLYDLARCDMAEAVEDAFRYDRLVLAAASYDGGVFPCMEDFLLHLKAKAYQKRTVALIENGSWAPSAGKCMKAILEGMKALTLVEPVVSIRSAMKPADEAALEALASRLMEA